MLADTMKELKELRFVNKKARDQYKGFMDQQEDLKQRIEEISETQRNIIELINTLDEKKEEAISRTFKGVSKGFSGIFNKLVPQGSAKLVMLKKSKEQLEEENKEINKTQNETPITQTNDFGLLQYPKQQRDEYSGISLKVIFPAFGSEAKTIQQLSGGQRTIVALSLIFAIQKCDPAPFYLFDEIDSNLDVVYRQAVAELIKEQSKDAQYVITTFRPELLLPANKFYEIRHQNKVSTISCVSKERALSVIKENEENKSNINTPLDSPLQTPKRSESSEE